MRRKTRKPKRSERSQFPPNSSWTNSLIHWMNLLFKAAAARRFLDGKNRNTGRKKEMILERRFMQSCVRAAPGTTTDSPGTLVGYAAKFSEPNSGPANLSQNLGGF